MLQSMSYRYFWNARTKIKTSHQHTVPSFFFLIQLITHSFCSPAALCARCPAGSARGTVAWAMGRVSCVGGLGHVLCSSLWFGKAGTDLVKSPWAAAKGRSQPAREPPGSSPRRGGSKGLRLVVAAGAQSCFVHLSKGS